MRTSLYAAVALSIFASVFAASPARADDLTAKMAPFSYLLGAPWNCTTNVPAMGGQPARTDQGTATFDVAPGNVVHNRVQTTTYAGDFYFGYSDRMSTYWQTSADNIGGHGFLTSSDGKTYTGTSSMGPMSMQDTVTYGKASENKVTVHEVLSGGPMAGTFDTVCTR
jgi:hypothetical protein